MLPEQANYRVLLVGGGVREQAIAEAIVADGMTHLVAAAEYFNPGIALYTDSYVIRKEDETLRLAHFAQKQHVDYAVIGTEKPLAHGIVNELEARGISAVGPTREAAQVEMNKLFLRELMKKHNLPGAVEYRHITSEDGLLSILNTGQEFAFKPLGLTGGKGVKVMGIQLEDKEAAQKYGSHLISAEGGFIAEEKLIGEEFTLQVFTDGTTLVPMPLVQDFKHAQEGNTGSLTGSMGSYSQADGLLPFVSQEEKDEAAAILKQVVDTLGAEGNKYKGIMYGQFMKTADGIKLVEINSRFGDPEGANVLSVLKTDFGEICRAIINETLADVNVEFYPKATVVKYIAPVGYPDTTQIGRPVDINKKGIEDEDVRLLWAKVTQSAGGVLLTSSSRTAALLAKGNSVAEAEVKAEAALEHVRHPHHVRHDIGKGILT